MSLKCRAAWSSILLSTALLDGCAWFDPRPNVTYQRVTTPKPGESSPTMSLVKSLASDQVVFGLRGTDITFLSKDADSACPSKVNPSRDEWSRCLRTAAVLLTPTVSSDQVFLMTGIRSANPFRTLHLYSAPLTDQLGNVSEVGFSTSDTTAKAIASIGAGAIAGSAFGPAGTVLGGLVAFAGAIGSSERAVARGATASDAKTEQLCIDNGASGEKRDSFALRPVVPSSIGLDQKWDPFTNCWRTLTMLKKGSVKSLDTAWSGWVFQLRLKDLPQGSFDESQYFAQEGNASKQLDASGSTRDMSTLFPYVPCQEAELRLSWATEMNKSEEDIAYRSIQLLVANPANIRYLEIPKMGTINFGKVCNASIVPGVFTGSTPQADTDALLKAVADIKAARH